METTHESSKQTLCSAQPAKPYAFSRKVFCEGMRDGVPIALGYFAVSFSLGIAARTAGFTPLQGFVASQLSIRLFILVWLGDGFPTVIRSVFRLSVGRFPALMRGGFPSVSWSENCTTGIGGTFTYRRLAAEKPVRLRSSSPAASSSFSAPFMVVQPLSSISAISAMG